jgi:hypothetical protein
MAGTEREANAHLTPPPGDGLRQHAEDPHRGRQQRNACEPAHHGNMNCCSATGSASIAVPAVNVPIGRSGSSVRICALAAAATSAEAPTMRSCLIRPSGGARGRRRRSRARQCKRDAQLQVRTLTGVQRSTLRATPTTVFHGPSGRCGPQSASRHRGIGLCVRHPARGRAWTRAVSGRRPRAGVWRARIFCQRADDGGSPPSGGNEKAAGVRSDRLICGAQGR